MLATILIILNIISIMNELHNLNRRKKLSTQIKKKPLSNISNELVEHTVDSKIQVD